MLFHHIGVACDDVGVETERFEHLGYVIETGDFVDEIQGVRVRFLVGGGPRLELVEPLSDGSILGSYLRGGGRMYHLAYHVDDLHSALEGLRSKGGKVLVAPVPAPAFGYQKIAFLMMRNMMLVELIEAGKE